MSSFRFPSAVTLALALSLSASVAAQTPDDFAPEPGAWFSPFAPPEPLATEQERQRADGYDGFVNRLVEADCPGYFPFSGADPWGDDFQTGDYVHPRVVEACLDRQVVLFTPVVAGLLDTLYSQLRAVEAETRRTDSTLTDALLEYHAAWLQGRDAKCNYEAAQYLGGTGANYAWLSCNVVSLKEHRAWVEREIEQSIIQ